MNRKTKAARGLDPNLQQLNYLHLQAQDVLSVFKAKGSWSCRLHSHEELPSKKGPLDTVKFFYRDEDMPSEVSWRQLAAHSQRCPTCALSDLQHNPETIVKELAGLDDEVFARHVKHLADYVSALLLQNAFRS